MRTVKTEADESQPTQNSFCRAQLSESLKMRPKSLMADHRGLRYETVLSLSLTFAPQ